MQNLNSWILLGIAAFNMAGAYFAYQAAALAKSTQSTIEVLEKNTNSIKDALVAKTGEAAHAAGKEEGRLEGEQKAAVLAEGVLNAKK